MSIQGNHVVDYENHMEIYVPTMIRGFSPKELNRSFLEGERRRGYENPT